MCNFVTPEQIEQAAKQRGIGMVAVCREAGVSFSTYSRWRARKCEPTLGVYRRLLVAVGIVEGVQPGSVA
ncbi:MAG: helix-turn-helix transcriptional regulator [Gluconobacter cerinus]|uniref:helix-turn-helix domain-containing protein n=1 Tax=Gluconobacter cerinus TaxID=38307 RepID=UPI0039EBFD06